MPDAADTLLAIAEIAITLAGFTGIVLIFRSDEPTEEETIRILNIFAICIFTVITALLPSALFEFGFETKVVWGIPVILLGFTVIAFPTLTSISYLRGKVTPVFPKFTIAIFVFWPLYGLTIMAYGFGAFGEVTASMLIATQILLLAFAGYLFVGALLWVRKE